MIKKTKLFLLFVCILMISLGAVFVLLEWYPVSDGPPNKELCFLSFNLIFFMLPIFFAALGAYIVVPLAFMGFFFVKGKTRSVLFPALLFLLEIVQICHSPCLYGLYRYPLKSGLVLSRPYFRFLCFVCVLGSVFCVLILLRLIRIINL